jgi:hypothetical protein
MMNVFWKDQQKSVFYELWYERRSSGVGLPSMCSYLRMCAIEYATLLSAHRLEIYLHLNI